MQFIGIDKINIIYNCKINFLKFINLVFSVLLIK